MGPPRGRCCCECNQHAVFCSTFQIVRSKHARGWFSSLSLSLCESVRFTEESCVRRPLSPAREAKRQLSFYPPAISSRSLSIDVHTMCIYAQTKITREIQIISREHKQNFPSHFRASHILSNALSAAEMHALPVHKQVYIRKRRPKNRTPFYMWIRPLIYCQLRVCAVKVKMVPISVFLLFTYQFANFGDAKTTNPINFDLWVTIFYVIHPLCVWEIRSTKALLCL